MNHSENIETKETFERNYQAGKQAFENGKYKASITYLETACALVNRPSGLGGEVQIWLVTAYQAANETEAAIALCEKLLLHPDSQTKKQAKNLIYILKAPQLKRPEEWMTNIPDLVNLEENTVNSYYANVKLKPQEKRDRSDKSSPLDPQEINNQDNQFTGFAFLVILLILGGLFFWSH
ncbi:tetratricopeptide repeat protein [Spirulina sp. 06S082]|uniref:tetratricopeptide repeat protein n=1 Tax=Spirulina sp. 06S082 TaxID=3110248 RepID=UPI002B2034FF|nr:tetratricopeptide repeat protein [Spirulina sp. 06S082]MEA5468428.1 tetratricopeptide repeat protein [Spirulina sp. 06S082]